MGGMGMPVEKALDFRVSLRRLLRMLRPDRAGVLAVGLLAVVSVALNVVGPKILGAATDLVFNGVISRSLPPGVTQQDAVRAAVAAGDSSRAQLLAALDLTPGVGIDFPALGRLLVLVLALFVGASVFGWLQGYILNGMIARIMYTLRSDVENKLNRLPLSYFDARTRGEVLSRVTNDIDNVSQSLQQTMSQLLNSLLTVLGVLVMMFLISPLLAVVGLVTVPLSALVTARIAKRSQPRFIAQWRTTGELNGQIEEAFSGHALVTVFGRQREVEERFTAKNEELFRAGFGAQFVSGIIMPAMMFLGNLNYVLIAVVGGLRVGTGSMTVGDIQAFLQYSRQFTQPLTQLASMANVAQSGVASAERVFELLDAEEQTADTVNTAVPSSTRGEVRFEHVDFAYRRDTPLITDLSLVARPGQTVAIVGPTGAGKTTLVNLILRFYEIDGGRITLDGVDIRSMSRHQLRSRIGMVLQDTWLFGGTIYDNIHYGNQNASRDDVMAAARATFVDRFVHSLPDGYETVIDDEGGNVSAGEKQLITIARAFLADPALLILDEATSSVDTRTELLVQRAMAALRSERTSFVIAHRLSTIRDADLILVMEAGAIVEQGTHDELLAAGGAYARLYRSQFAGAAAETG
jgi:ATP-binding cassette subfamily B multidrug efflux pump